MIELLTKVSRDLARAANVSWDSIHGIGVGAPGHIHDGVIHGAANFPGWRDQTFAKDLAKHLQKPVFALNDADAAILAECWVGLVSLLAGPLMPHLDWCGQRKPSPDSCDGDSGQRGWRRSRFQ